MKIAALTDPEAAAGYRLAGVEVVLARDPAEAREALRRLVQEGGYALVAVSATLLADPHQAVRSEMRGRDLPVLLSVPSHRTTLSGAGEDAEGYLRRLIRETLGHEVKLRKPGPEPQASAGDARGRPLKEGA